MGNKDSQKSFIVPFFIFLILIITGVSFWYVRELFINNWDNKTINFYSSFSDYGSFMAGTLGVVLSAANVLFLLYIWREQKALFLKQEKEQKVKFEQERIESRFFNLLEMRVKIRDEIICDKLLWNEKIEVKGYDAINEIAEMFKPTVQDLSFITSHITRIQDLYKKHSLHLRRYFDLTLFIIEYIDKHFALDEKQKIEYIAVLTSSSTYNEILIWKMMQYDYETNEQSKQDTRFIALNNKYKFVGI